ncbi:phosphotransferase [Arthrobacter sp. AZCC_0090]|uniref:phosphotransferase n=1 Tax=Arthrobacter sp. AZCC_0090 TaxID=2735881 RepID=UPI001838845E|nr:phosphotransferase [Arthrobacter sp. AZCC_0090]MBB6405324.1 Ser/Thr protein kinase RdoA (MazF antagonist) [Arthrobacter sp. AZCC_0090]
MSDLYQYDADGTSAAIKVRADSLERVNRCLDAQRKAAKEGFACAKPLTVAGMLDDGLVVSAEEWRPGGEMLRDDDGGAAHLSAVLLAQLMEILAGEASDEIGPPPPWVHWNPPGGGVWARNGPLDQMDQRLVPESIRDHARRVSARLRQSPLPRVIGHGDLEAQNIRWKDSKPWAVFDWDSLVSLPEAAIVGAASGAFASAETPTLAPIESSGEFIDSYEWARGRPLTKDEREVSWAASLWPALHNARGEHLFRSPLIAAAAITDQAEQRLALAKA